MTNTDPVVIVGTARTAMGGLQGDFKDVAAAKLGAAAIKAAVERAGISAEQVEEVIMGCVLPAGQGQAPARQASLGAGLPLSAGCTTINKMCGSGMKAAMLAHDLIVAGTADIMVAGGMESMTNAPYLLDSRARWGLRMGNAKLIDVMIQDGLWCAFNDYHMGITAENVSEQYGISREAQDQLAFESQQKALKAIKEGMFKREIIPVTIKSKKGDTIFDTDEHPKSNATLQSLCSLKPAFKKDGVVTAGNASGLNDGGAALVVMSGEKAKELGIKPLARILSYASGGVDPRIMGMGPVSATQKALQKAGLTMQDVDLIEANEAFAAQFLAVGKELQFMANRVNIYGGAIALGHPIGASGARILVTLLTALEQRQAKIGLATLCIGGGQGVATIVERL